MCVNMWDRYICAHFQASLEWCSVAWMHLFHSSKYFTREESIMKRTLKTLALLAVVLVTVIALAAFAGATSTAEVEYTAPGTDIAEEMTLADAMAKVEENKDNALGGGTVKILQDVTVDASAGTNGYLYRTNAAFTLDLNGKTITSTGGCPFRIFAGGYSTSLTDAQKTFVVKNGTIKADSTACIYLRDGNLDMDNVNLIAHTTGPALFLSAATSGSTCWADLDNSVIVAAKSHAIYTQSSADGTLNVDIEGTTLVSALHNSINIPYASGKNAVSPQSIRY